MFKNQSPLYLSFAAVISLIPILCVIAPKAYTAMPAAIGLIFFVIFYCRKELTFKPPKAVLVLIGVILMFAWTSVLWSVDRQYSIERALKLSLLLPPQIFLIMILNNLDLKKLHPLQYALPIALVFGSVLMALELKTGGYFYASLRGLDPGEFSEPFSFNRPAIAFVLISFLSYGLLSQLYSKRISFVLIFIPLSIGIFLCQSQSAQLGLMLGLLVFLLFPYRSQFAFRFIKYILIASLFLTPLVMPLIHDLLSQNINNIGFFARGNTGERLEIYDYISRYILENPILGNGIAATRMITDFDSDNVFFDIAYVMHPHNAILQIWLEFGLFGILATSLMIFTFFRHLEAHYTPQQWRIILPTITAAFVPLNLAFGLWQGAWLGVLFFIIALTVFTLRVTDSFIGAHENTSSSHRKT